MKTILTLLLTASTLFANPAKDFQVTEIKPNGFIIHELVIKEYKTGNIAPTRFEAPTSTARFGGNNSMFGGKKEVLSEETYFIQKNNSNFHFKMGHKFNATFDKVKMFEKNGKKIELISLKVVRLYVAKTK